MIGQREMQTDQARPGDICERGDLALEIAEKRHDTDGIQTPVGHEAADRAIDTGRQTIIVGADAWRFHYLHFTKPAILSPQSCPKILSSVAQGRERAA